MSVGLLSVRLIFGSKEENEVAGFFVFSHIRMRGYIRLGLVMLNESPAGARKRRKANVKKN